MRPTELLTVTKAGGRDHRDWEKAPKARAQGEVEVGLRWVTGSVPEAGASVVAIRTGRSARRYTQGGRRGSETVRSPVWGEVHQPKVSDETGHASRLERTQAQSAARLCSVWLPLSLSFRIDLRCESCVGSKDVGAHGRSPLTPSKGFDQSPSRPRGSFAKRSNFSRPITENAERTERRRQQRRVGELVDVVTPQFVLRPQRSVWRCGRLAAEKT